MSKLSILGLYQHDQTLFDNLQLPTEFTTEDRETLINNLLMECAEFECTYPAFDFCKAAIGFWSKARLHVWQKLYRTMFFEYNPIWNKDGTITETRTKEYSGEKAGTVASTKEYSDEKAGTVASTKEYSDEKAGTVASTKESTSESVDALSESHNMSGTQESTTENKTAGFNSSDYVKHDKSEVDATSSETGTNTARRTVNDSGSESGSTTESGTTSGSESGSTTESGTTSGSESGSTTESGTTSGEETEEYTRTEQGNIGLTSTQQLIKEEREVVQFEIDDYIINDFKKQFCVLVY